MEETDSINSATEFTVSFRGQGLADHAMDVRDLAPALMALGQIFEHSSKVINGDRVTVTLSTVALSPGSFSIHFALYMGVIDGIVDFFSNDKYTAAQNILELTFGGVSLVALIKFLRNRVPTEDEVSENDDGTVTILDEDGQEGKSFPKEVYDLYTDFDVRMDFQKAISPLEREGIEKFVVLSDYEVESEIHDYEYEFFRFKEDLADIVNVTERAAYRIVSLTFREGNKWRLSSGDNADTISAAIRDEQFIEGIKKRESQFSDGDILICDVRKRQYMDGPNLKVEYEIIKVHEHKHFPQQIEIDMQED